MADAHVSRESMVTGSPVPASPAVPPRDRQEADLRRRERQLSAAQTLAQIGSWEWDVASDEVSWSDELYHIWGLRATDVPLTLESYLAGLHPEDVAAVRRAVDHALAACAPFEFVHRVVRADGVRWIQSRGEVVCEGGRPRLMRGTAQDVTERREREERELALARAQAARQAAEAVSSHMQFLADASERLASSLDYEQTLRTVARLALPDLADVCAVDIVTGAAVERVAVEGAGAERGDLVRRLRERAPDRADPPFGVRTVLRTGRAEVVEDAADGAYRDRLHELELRSWAVLPLRVADAVIGALTFVQAESGRRFTAADLPLLEDLARRAAVAIHHARLVAELSDARARLEQQAVDLEAQTLELEEMMAELEQRNEELQAVSEQANQARDEAQRAHAARSQFLAGMSHELRTPLNAIAGYSELLELGIPGPINAEQREIVARVQRNQRRLLGLINDILNFTHLTGTRIQFPLERVPLAPLLAGLEPLIAPQLARRQIAYEYRPVPDNMTVLTNAERLEQILLNLLSNALKFTAPGGWIRVSAATADDRVEVRVEDTGRGIPPEQQLSIFDPFVQIDPEPSRQNAGVGLGLAISRELARAMHGEIHVHSEPGQGSRFTVRLPTP